MDLPEYQPDQERPDLEQTLFQNAQAYLEAHHSGGAEAPELRRAWDEFYDMVESRLLHMALQCHVPPGDPDDLVQEVWLKAEPKLLQFCWQGAKKSWGWLHQFVTREATYRMRQRGRHPVVNILQFLHTEREPTDRGDGPPLYAQRQELREGARQVLEQLQKLVSKKNYTVFYRRVVEQTPIPEIAADLGLSSDQVWARLYRTKRRFCNLLNNYAGEHGRDFFEDF